MDALKRGVLRSEMVLVLKEGPATTLTGEHLLTLVQESLGLAPELCPEFGWQVLVRAARLDLVDDAGKRPLAAVRYLLDLNSLPTGSHEELPDLDGRTWADLYDERRDVFARVPPRLPLPHARQRQLLAVLAGRFGEDHTNLATDTSRMKKTAAALLEAFEETLGQSATRKQADRLKWKHRVRGATSSKRRLAVIGAGAACLMALATWFAAGRPESALEPLVLEGSLTEVESRDDDAPIDVTPGASLMLRLQFTLSDREQPVDSLRVLLRYSETAGSQDRQEANFYVSAGERPTFDYEVEGASLPLLFADDSICATAAKPRVSTATRVERDGSIPPQELFSRNLPNGYVGQERGAQIELRDAFAELTLLGVPPGEPVEVHVPVRFSDREVAAFTGNTLEYRAKGSQDFKQSGAIERGSEVEFRLGIRDYSCSTTPHDPLVRVELDNSGAGFTEATARLSGPGLRPAVIGETLLNYTGNVNARLFYKPGSTRLETAAPPSCNFTSRELEDGLTQGGIVIKDVVGYRPGEQCDGNVGLNFLYFDAKVE